MSGRCRQCNSILKGYEMAWSEERKEHNDTCTKCLSLEVSDDIDQVIDDMYLSDIVNTDEVY